MPPKDQNLKDLIEIEVIEDIDISDIEKLVFYEDQENEKAEVPYENEVLLLVKECLLFLIFKPLSIAASVLAFIAHCIGYLASLGILAALYYCWLVYKDISANKILTNYDNIKYGLEFFFFPMIVLGLSSIMRGLSLTFDALSKNRKIR